MPDAPPDPSPLLLSSELTHAQVTEFLRPFRIIDWAKADRHLQAMAGDPQERRAMVTILQDLLIGNAETADPDFALNQWEHFLASGLQRKSLFEFLAQAPGVLRILCTVFGNSPAMAETLIRDPMLVYWLGEEWAAQLRASRTQVAQRLHLAMSSVTTYALKMDVLRRVKRREMLRIGVRDLLRFADVTDTVVALSDLADLIIQAAYALATERIQAQHGRPRVRGPRGAEREPGFAVLGMGKLGGGELNYSSDVDLVYIHGTDDGDTMAGADQTSVTNEVYFEMLARELTQVLTETTHEGFVFRVDLRLRPEGDVGSLSKSLTDALRYYQVRGRDWERLAFLKARTVAGDPKLGATFLRRLQPFVRGEPTDAPQNIPQAVTRLKREIHQKLQRRGEDTRHVKLGTGGIREIEFLVQMLQLRHVHDVPNILQRNTRKALRRLQAQEILPASTVEHLDAAYRFLRDVEHKLQMVDDLQTHLIPVDRDDIGKCAVRMGYAPVPSRRAAAEAFLADLSAHTSVVHREFLQTLRTSAPNTSDT